MKFGLVMFLTDYSIRPAELAKEVEARGFESLFFPEHTHIPSSRRTPWRGGREVPREYPHLLDPFVALASAATTTKHLRVATGICLVVERDPIILAKEVATLDFLSGGRVLFGIGGGWNREEMENHGASFPRRWKLVRERVEAMKEIWTQEEATYHGEFVNFDAIWSWPKPLQRPHPPVLVGGDGERTLERVVRYGDEWMPNAQGVKTYGDKIQELNERASAAGRGPIPVTIFFAPPDPRRLEQYESEGASRALFALPCAEVDVVLPKLDELADVARKIS